MIEFIKITSLFVSVWMTAINVSKLIHKNSISSINFVFQAIGITAFIYLQWLR